MPDFAPVDHETQLARSPLWWLRLLRPSVWGPEAMYPVSFGVGGVLVYEFIKLIASNPTMAYPLLMKWGPNVFAVIIVASILGAFLNQLVGVMRENAAAQMEMARNLGTISERMPDRSSTDDMKLQISFVAQQQSESREDVRGMKRALERIENHFGINPPDDGANK